MCVYIVPLYIYIYTAFPLKKNSWFLRSSCAPQEKLTIQQKLHDSYLWKPPAAG